MKKSTQPPVELSLTDLARVTGGRGGVNGRGRGGKAN